MLERELLLNTALALVLLYLASHTRWGRGWLHRWSFGLLAGGVLLPLVDLPLGYLLSEDRIEFLINNVFLGSLGGGGLFLGAVGLLLCFGVSPRRVLLMAGWTAAGLGLTLLLLATSEHGAPLLAPFSPLRVSLLSLPIGHPLLLGLLLATALAMESLPHWRPMAMRAAAGLAVLYAVWSCGQLTWLFWQTRELARTEGQVEVHPDNLLLYDWQVVVERPEEYFLRRHHLLKGKFDTPRRFYRWDNESLLIRAQGDPVVFRYYHQVFQHPVVRLSASGGTMSVLMNELSNQMPLVPGRTFYLEGDLSGRNRLYQLQRFQ